MRLHNTLPLEDGRILAAQHTNVPLTRYFTATFHKSSGRLVMRSTGLSCREHGSFTIFSGDDSTGLPGEATLEEMALRCKGVLIDKEPSHGPRIYLDPFCSVPVYFRDTADAVYLSSCPHLIVDYASTPLDPVGFWETVLTGSGIWTRTPFRDLKQLPVATCLDLKAGCRVSRYWHFADGYASGTGIQNERDWLAGLDVLLTSRFAEISNRKLVVGLSGGVDSRIMALYLTEIGCHPRDIHLFTYAANRRSNEVRFASEVAGLLQYSLPEMFLLRERHYSEALDYLPFWTAGQLGNNHSHMAELLRERGPSFPPGTVHVSSYYSDALFGAECSGVSGELGVGGSVAYNKVLNSRAVPNDIREEMLEDIRLALSDAAVAKGFSDIAEYSYFTERHGRILMPLAHVQSQFMPTRTPFADFALLRYMLAVPLSLRKRKRIVDELIAYKMPTLAAIGNSSSREYFYGSNSLMVTRGLRDKLHYLEFRLLNAVNGCLVYFGDGVHLLTNPYQTEELAAVFKRSYAGQLKKDLEASGISALLPGPVLDELVRPRIREKHLSEKFQLLSLARLLMTHSDRANGAIAS